MYTLFIANKIYSSWSQRPWVLMRALGIAFEEKVVPFGVHRNWEQFRTFSPNGKVPCLHSDGQAICDSMAITEYLAEHHAGVWPGDSLARTWARCAAAEMHSGFGALRQSCSFHVGVRMRLHDIRPELQADLDRLDELWSQGLTRFGGPFLAAPSFTAVDAFFAPVVCRIQTYGLTLSNTSMAYVQHLLAQAALQQWQAEALTESWREPGHEQNVMAAGTLLQDLRAQTKTA